MLVLVQLQIKQNVMMVETWAWRYGDVDESDVRYWDLLSKQIYQDEVVKFLENWMCYFLHFQNYEIQS
jgi:hypothetical protein